MKPTDVASDSYTEHNEGSNVTKPNLTVGDHVRISKYKTVFAKGYTQNWSKFLLLAKLRIQSRGDT